MTATTRTRLATAAGLTLAATLLLSCRASTAPFTDAAGHVVPGSIASMERIRIGGTEQSVWFRGRDVRAPILILLHGGPGASESALFRHYVPALERHFLVVYWDQRGAGRSYDGDLPRDSMTIARIVRDLDELVDTVRARFGQERVALLGHSWGTIVGTRYAYERPEKVSVYAGVAQIANFGEGERVSLRWALDQAVARGDGKAVRRLRAMAPRPRNVDDELALGRIVERLAAPPNEPRTHALIWAALHTDEATLGDLVRFGRGNDFSLHALRAEYGREDLTRLHAFRVPVVFLLGRHDWHVPAVLAARYYDTIAAPCKRLVWFEHSAHNPPFAEPERFVRVVVDSVLPLAREGCPRGRDRPSVSSRARTRGCPSNGRSVHRVDRAHGSRRQEMRVAPTVRRSSNRSPTRKTRHHDGSFPARCSPRGVCPTHR